MTVKVDRPDSDFAYRIISGYEGRRLTWHSLDCATGKRAKHSRRTAHTPETRRDALKAQNKAYKEQHGWEPSIYYDDYWARCCLDRQSADTVNSPKFTKTQAKRLFANALEAGIKAGNSANPTPMVVGTPTTFLGNDIDYDKKTYYVPDGVCGFAWVVIKPATSSLALRAKQLGLGHKEYGGGYSISVREHGQSLERKEKHARAYAKVLSDAGVNAYSQSRID